MELDTNPIAIVTVFPVLTSAEEMVFTLTL
jgi:hypothetical protein